jgi:hypothetical protein
VLVVLDQARMDVRAWLDRERVPSEIETDRSTEGD